MKVDLKKNNRNLQNGCAKPDLDAIKYVIAESPGDSARLCFLRELKILGQSWTSSRYGRPQKILERIFSRPGGTTAGMESAVVAFYRRCYDD